MFFLHILILYHLLEEVIFTLYYLYTTTTFLVTDDEAGIDLQEIHRFLREIGIAAYKMPDQIEWVETWPLTSVGKIDKKALERMAQEK